MHNASCPVHDWSEDLGGVPGASGRRELAMVDLAKDDRHKLMFRFRESKGYHEDAVDRKLLAHRHYASLSRYTGHM